MSIRTIYLSLKKITIFNRTWYHFKKIYLTILPQKYILVANFTNIESELIRMFDPVLYFFVKSTSFSTGIVFWSREDSSVGGGLSASAGGFHIVPIKKEGRHSLGRWVSHRPRPHQKRIIPFRQNRPHSFWRWFFSLGRLMEWLQLCCYKRLSLLKLKIIIWFLK